MPKGGVVLSEGLAPAVLDKIPDMVRVIDAEGRVLYANSMFRSKLGDGIGETCLKIPGAADYCDSCIAQKCIKEERRYSMLSHVKRKVYAISAGPVNYNGAVYALEIFRDITEEQNLKDKLMANNSRMKGAKLRENRNDRRHRP